MIETTITKIQYDSNGVQRRWSIPFPYADEKHISIYTKIGEEPTIKVVDNYDIDKDDSVVIYPTIESGQEPLSAGTKITIARETPETQLEDSSQIHFTSADVERGLDKLTMITQELSTTAGETMEVSADAFEAAEEAVNSAAQANRTAEEAKTIAGQAVDIATDAKSIAEGIDAKAVQALDNSNTAINTANSAKQTAEGIDGKATQALTNSTTALETATEAKNTADSYQGQITTIRNDVDDLGDQVSVIESKIPAEASETNQLADKNYVDNNIQQGVYTQSNLLAGKDIEIIDEPVEGGIDEHTMGCWHFDGNNENAVAGSSMTMGNVSGYEEGKFGSACRRPSQKASGFTPTGDFSYDFWIKATGALNTRVGGNTSSATGKCARFYILSSKKVASYISTDASASTNPSADMPLNTWTHLAYCKKDGIGYWFVNGKLIDKRADTTTTTSSWSLVSENPDYYQVDEYRISDIARYTEDFEVPTKPYALATPTGNRIINYTGKAGGSGFDFQGTKAEFDAAVAAGTITEDSVSLITDDVDGANVATKAELQAVESEANNLTNLTAQGKSLASGLGMPSNRYIDLTLGASDSTYTAPANGWFVFRGTSTATSQYSNIIVYDKNNNFLYTSTSQPNGSGYNAEMFAPVLKEYIVRITYSVTAKKLRFIYAEGDE